MASGAQLLEDGSLVYIWLSGRAKLGDPYEELRELQERGELKPGVPVLVDLAKITAFDRDAKLVMRLNLEIDDMLQLFGEETLLLIHAPNTLSREMAGAILDLWEGSEVVIVRICEDELGALMILGRHERDFSELRFAARAAEFANTTERDIF
ncbi:MAG: hypothetical protein AAGA47_04185 [Pseudomonadota bacterium]